MTVPAIPALMSPRHPDDLLTTGQAAADYRMSASWFAHTRLKGTGPKFMRMGGKVLYRRSAIEEYLTQRTFSSTSQAA